MNVEHQPEMNRFVINTEQGQSELTYVREANFIDYTHTFVHPGDRGTPVGRSLVSAALEWGDTQNTELRASCWYVEKQLARRKG